MPGEKKVVQARPETGLLSMIDEKDVTLGLHRNWGQLYLSNAPSSLNRDKPGAEDAVPYQSIVIFFGTDPHNLDFLRSLQAAVEKAVRWVEQELSNESV